jgi:hypothetical protein
MNTYVHQVLLLQLNGYFLVAGIQYRCDVLVSNQRPFAR